MPRLQRRCTFKTLHHFWFNWYLQTHFLVLRLQIVKGHFAAVVSDYGRPM